MGTSGLNRAGFARGPPCDQVSNSGAGLARSQTTGYVWNAQTNQYDWKTTEPEPAAAAVTPQPQTQASPAQGPSSQLTVLRGTLVEKQCCQLVNYKWCGGFWFADTRRDWLTKRGAAISQLTALVRLVVDHFQKAVGLPSII